MCVLNSLPNLRRFFYLFQFPVLMMAIIFKANLKLLRFYENMIRNRFEKPTLQGTNARLTTRGTHEKILQITKALIPLMNFHSCHSFQKVIISPVITQNLFSEGQVLFAHFLLKI
jgi:hypothetical protein